jgi:hypothetical protein
MVARDQPRKCFLGAGSKLVDQSRLFRLDRQRAGYIAHGEVRLQFVLPPYRKLDVVCTFWRINASIAATQTA